MNCRFLKIVRILSFLRLAFAHSRQKCDGAKPICGPCLRAPKDDECEYADGPTRSRTKALEDTVQRLEARLHELEHPDETTPSITLYDPYSALPPPPPPGRLSLSNSNPDAFGHPGHRSLPPTPFGSALPRLLMPGTGSTSSPESHLASLSPPSTTASTPPLVLFGHPGHGRGTSLSPSPLGIFDSHRAVAVSTPDSSASSMHSLDLNDPHVCEPLIHTFLPFASQFGLFLDLDPQRFASSQQYSPSTLLTLALRRTSPALLYTICAFGARLSPSRDRVNEDRFLFNALQACVAVADLKPQPQSALQSIQAEVFLGHYFWHAGAFLRARVHAATAAALATGLGLHQPALDAPPTQVQVEEQPQTKRPSPYQSPVSSVTAVEQRLPSPTHPLDAGERVRAVWAVLGLQQQLAVAIDAPVDVCAHLDGGIQAPWPREIEDYLSSRYDWAETMGTESTIRRYLSGQEPQSQTEESASTVLAKAQLLFHRSMILHAQSTQQQRQPQQQQAQAIASRYQTLNALVEALRLRLPSREPRSRRSSEHSSSSSGSQMPQSESYARRASADSAYSQSQGSEYGYTSASSSPEYSTIPIPRASESFAGRGSDAEQDSTLATMRLVHALLDGASLHLHEVFVRMYGYGADGSADERYVQIAMELLRAASSAPMVVPTIFGTLWTHAIRVLVNELQRRQQQQHQQQQIQAQYAQPRYEFDREYEKSLNTCVLTGLAALQRAAPSSAAIQRELGRAREAVNTAGLPIGLGSV
uniref:Transcription factor domain-containing protein n=1 Tax=Mycena chlorophos TaxID=658473 RepID=A0ABQ0LTR7_MYCCL|nr:predicted protein [Mycena chlorophos]